MECGIGNVECGIGNVDCGIDSNFKSSNFKSEILKSVIQFQAKDFHLNRSSIKQFSPSNTLPMIPLQEYESSELYQDRLK